MTLHRLPPPTRSSTWKSLADARHVEAVALLRAGNITDGWEMLQDVRELDEKARIARVREDAREGQGT